MMLMICSVLLAAATTAQPPHNTSTAQTTTFWTELLTAIRTMPQHWTRFRTSNTTTTTFRTTPQHWTRFRTSNTTTTTFRTEPYGPRYGTPTTWTSYTQTTTFTSTASTTTTIGGVGGCQDKAEWCARHVWSCKSPSDRRRNHMHTTCPKTCHLCDCKCNVQKFAPWDDGGSWCESATYTRSGRGRYGYPRYVRRNFCYVAQTHSCPADEIESTLFGDDRQVISYYACTMLNNTTNSATTSTYTTTPWTRYSTTTTWTPYATTPYRTATPTTTPYRTTSTTYSTTTWTPYATTPYRTATPATTPYRTTSTTPATSTGMTSTTIPFWTATPTTTPFRTTSTTPAPSTGTTSSTFRSTPSPRPDSRLRLRFTSTTKMTIGAEDVTSTPRIMAVSSSTPSPNTQ